jgi:hypothetical protein
MTQQKKEEEVVRKCLEALGKHFDNIQIFANKLIVSGEETDEEGNKISELSVAYNDGKGNLYARYGQVKQWILDQEL